MTYYAVSNGRQPGVYDTWPECAKQIINYRAAFFKKFKKLSDAKLFVKNNSHISDVQYYPSSQYVSAQRKNTTISHNVAFIDIDLNEDAKKQTKQMHMSKIINRLHNSLFRPTYYVYVSGVNTHDKIGIGIYFGQDDCRNLSQCVDESNTHEYAELVAFLHTYHIIQQDLHYEVKITLVTKSNYAIKCLTTNGWAWSTRSWDILLDNKKIIKQVYQLFESHNSIKFMNIDDHQHDQSDKHDHKECMSRAEGLANLSVGITTL